MKLIDSVNAFYYRTALDNLRCMNRFSRKSGFSYNSLLYLDLISCDSYCTISSLAKVLNISKPAVSSKINEMAEQGLVCKKRSERDKRVVYLSVGENARETYDEYDRRLLVAAQQVERDFSPQQIDDFCRILDILVPPLYDDSKSCEGTLEG